MWGPNGPATSIKKLYGKQGADSLVQTSEVPTSEKMPSKSKMFENSEMIGNSSDTSDIDFNLSGSESEEMDLSEHSSDEEFLNVSNFFYFIYFIFF